MADSKSIRRVYSTRNNTSLSDKIGFLTDDFRLNLKLLDELHDSLSKYEFRTLDVKMRKLKQEYEQLSEVDKEDYGKLLNISQYETVSISNPRVAALFDLRQELLPTAGISGLFVARMSLVYLVAMFEEYLNGMLQTIFNEKPEMVKGIKKTITAEEVFGFEHINEVKERFIQKELTSIISDDPVAINRYLKQNHKLSLDQNYDWNEFKEVFYRRHIIIHNNGNVDEKYRQKTGYDGNEKHLGAGQPYVKKSIQLFERYCVIINDFFQEKFTNPKVT